MSDWSLNEKTALGTLIAVAATALYYFSEALELYRAGTTDPGRIAVTAISAMVLLVVIQVVYHAVTTRRGDTATDDERDREIRIRAGHVSGLVLSVGVVAALGHIVLGSLFVPGELGSDSHGMFVIANILMGALVASELTEQAWALILYRRGL